MKKGEYLRKRKEMVNQARAAIEKDDYETGEDLLYKVGVMDVEYEEEKQERLAHELANERALNGERTNFIPPWFSGEGVNLDSGRSWTGSAAIQNQLFLAPGRSMTDRARESDPDAYALLNCDGALGDVVRGIVTGNWKTPELRNAVTTTSSGALIPQVLSAQIIDLMRNLSLFTAAGVPVAPMESNNLTVSRIAKDPAFSFKAEGAEAAESSFELDAVQLKSRTCYGYAYVTLEAIQSSKNLDAVIRQTFAQAMANSIDLGMLYGQANETGFDDFAPSGIMNDPDILTVEAGTSTSYDDFVKASASIKKQNGIPSIMAINATTEERLDLLKNSDGEYITPPASLAGLSKIVSNQLKSDESAGSDALVFDPTAMIIGMQNNLQIKIIEDSECLKKGLVGFQIFSMLDCKTVRPKAICKISGLK